MTESGISEAREARETLAVPALSVRMDVSDGR